MAPDHPPHDAAGLQPRRPVGSSSRTRRTRRRVQRTNSRSMPTRARCGFCGLRVHLRFPDHVENSQISSAGWVLSSDSSNGVNLQQLCGVATFGALFSGTSVRRLLCARVALAGYRSGGPRVTRDRRAAGRSGATFCCSRCSPGPPATRLPPTSPRMRQRRIKHLKALEVHHRGSISLEVIDTVLSARPLKRRTTR